MFYQQSTEAGQHRKKPPRHNYAETYLGEHEVAVDDATEAEYAKDDVRAPLDVLKRGRDKVRKSEIEEPVGGRGKANALGTVLQREDFRDEDPCARSPCQPVEPDKDIAARNNTGGVAPVHLPLDVGVVANMGDRVTTCGHQTGNSEVERSHGDTTVDEQRTTAKLVNEAQSDGCSDDEYDVLNGRRDEVHVSSKTGHLEDVHDVVHHDVSAEKLLPDLGGESSAVGFTESISYANGFKVIGTYVVRLHISGPNNPNQDIASPWATRA